MDIAAAQKLDFDEEEILNLFLNKLHSLHNHAMPFEFPRRLEAVSPLDEGRNLRRSNGQVHVLDDTTNGNGWFYNYVTLNSQTCSDTSPAVVSGVFINQCLRDTDTNERSFFITCDNSSKQFNFFNIRFLKYYY